MRSRKAKFVVHGALQMLLSISDLAFRATACWTRTHRAFSVSSFFQFCRFGMGRFSCDAPPSLLLSHRKYIYSSSMRCMSRGRASAAALPALPERRGPMRLWLAVVHSMRGVLPQVRLQRAFRGHPCRGGAEGDDCPLRLPATR